MPLNLLIVEDNADIARLVAFHARALGCDADIVGDGQQATQMFKQRDYDLIVLDLMLPGLDGLDVCRWVRAQSHYVPILMLTSKSSEIDRVLGLEVGADDYLTKPFSIPELKARIKAQFRRSAALRAPSGDGATRIRCGELLIEIDKHRVSVDARDIALTAREFDLLVYFARHPGRVYSRLELLERVWGYQHEGYEHTVNSHINRLRAKIERNPNDPQYILTVWGVGYRFCERIP
ncbi:MAG: response regulator transcription factor [Gammaproteobacteria bacterium]|nr:response regulator transcription factor [Gammaproteobacteria bacterium]